MPAVKDVEIVQAEKASSGAVRIVEVARDACVSLVEDDGLLDILARVPQGRVPEELLTVAAEVMTWLSVHDRAGDVASGAGVSGQGSGEPHELD